jgi:hypothetical protein
MSEEIAAELGRLAWRIARPVIVYHGHNIAAAALVSWFERGMLRRRAS